MSAPASSPRSSTPHQILAHAKASNLGLFTATIALIVAIVLFGNAAIWAAFSREADAYKQAILMACWGLTALTFGLMVALRSVILAASIIANPIVDEARASLQSNPPAPRP